MLIVTLIQIPASILNLFIVDLEIVGRQTTIIICIVMQIIGLLISALLAGDEYLTIGVSWVIFFCSIWFNTLYPYTCEMFETEIRSMAIGFCNILGRVGGVCAPIVLFNMHALH